MAGARGRGRTSQTRWQRKIEWAIVQSQSRRRSLIPIGSRTAEVVRQIAALFKNDSGLFIGSGPGTILLEPESAEEYVRTRFT